MAHSSDTDNITYGRLEQRLLDANNRIDSKRNYTVLDTINEPNVSIGSGGSYPAAIFGSKILTDKGIISINMTPRDVIYNLKGINNLICYSWSGSSYGIIKAMDHYPKSIVVHGNEKVLHEKEVRLHYDGMDKEHSFISEATTLIPMGELLKYYLHNKGINEEEYLNSIIKDTFKNTIMNYDVDTKVYEIMSGDDTNTSSHILESAMSESGIGVPLLHEKYEYCHGRSVTSSTNRDEHILIYLINQETELDRFLLDIIVHNYKNVIVLRSNTNDRIVGEYILALKAYILCNYISKIKGLGLSQVEYDPSVVKKAYRYKGEL
jgi:hypothetical protein